LKLALIADIHGNLAALEAVLAEIEREHAEAIVCLGDVAATGHQPLGSTAPEQVPYCRSSLVRTLSASGAVDGETGNDQPIRFQ
jgi:predicted phosphodiesterase